MVSIPSEHRKPEKSRVFWVWSAHFWIWSRRPRTQGVGVDPFYARIDCAQCRSSLIRESQTDVCWWALAAVFLLHSCPWSLEPVRAVVNIHMLSIHRSRLQAASLDTPPSRACGVSIHIEKSKLGIPNSHIPTQLNSARFLASRHHNVAIDLVL